MELTEKIFEQIYNGWDTTGRINWKSVDESTLKKYCQFIINNGIVPMLNDLGINLPIDPKVHADNVYALDKETFSKLMIITFPEDEEYKDFYDKRNEIIKNGVKKEPEDILPLCMGEKLNIGSIIPLYEEIMKLKGNPYGCEACDECQVFQGYSYKKNQIINKDSASSELGLHLLCHELMHTMANETSVCKLRQNAECFGDEDVNEYFARLSSYYCMKSGNAEPYENFLGGTTTEEMKKSKDPLHGLNGSYGVLIKKRKRFDKMTVDRLKEIARFYFKGEKAPENFMNII